MILYNVTVKVDSAIHEEWLEWMRRHHIPATMATGKFREFKLCRLLHEEPDGVTYAVQYFSPDMKTFHQYYANDAPRLQQTHKERFGDRFVAIRTLMEVIESKEFD